MKAPKILPWIAHKDGISDQLALILWRRAAGEAEEMSGCSEYVEHHVKEEQTKMFPKVKATSLDLLELGARMAARKADLLAARG